MIPVAIKSPKEDDEQDLYLNINLSHEMVSQITAMRFNYLSKCDINYEEKLTSVLHTFCHLNSGKM